MQQLETSLIFRDSAGSQQQFVRTSDEFRAFEITILSGKQALASTLQNRDQILQVYLSGIVRRNEVFESSLEVLSIDGGFVLQAASHLTSHQHRFKICSREASGTIADERLDISRKGLHANFPLHRT